MSNIYITQLGEEVDMDVEIWRPYQQYRGNGKGVLITDIEISNWGNVRPGKANIFDGKLYEGIHEVDERMMIGKKWIYRLVDLLFNGELPEGYVIHHKDFNKLNDRLDNLQRMTNAEHMNIHRSEWEERRIENTKKYWQSEEAKQIQSDRMRNILQDEDIRNTISEKVKESWNKPGKKEAQAERMRIQWEDPKRLEALSKLTKGSKWYNNGIKNARFFSYEDAVKNGYSNVGRTKNTIEK